MRPGEGPLRPAEGASAPGEGAFPPREGPLRPAEGAFPPAEGALRPAEGPFRPREGAFSPGEGASRPPEGAKRSAGLEVGRGRRAGRSAGGEKRWPRPCGAKPRRLDPTGSDSTRGLASVYQGGPHRGRTLTAKRTPSARSGRLREIPYRALLERLGTRPNGPGEPSPGLRPKADALGKRARTPCGLKGRENLGWIEPRTVSRALAALQAALVCCAFSPGHRPPASALGWALPARWAGFVRSSYPFRTSLTATRTPAARSEQPGSPFRRPPPRQTGGGPRRWGRRSGSPGWRGPGADGRSGESSG